MENEEEVNITNVGGDVIGTNISGSSNIIGKSINIGTSDTIGINSQILNNLAPEYSNAFREFTEKINVQVKKNSITPQQLQPIQESVNELAKETESLTVDKQLSFLKQQSWKEKFFKVLKNVLPVLPKTAETITAFTPLAPFSKIIGEAVEKVVEGVQKEV